MACFFHTSCFPRLWQNNNNNNNNGGITKNMINCLVFMGISNSLPFSLMGYDRKTAAAFLNLRERERFLGSFFE